MLSSLNSLRKIRNSELGFTLIELLVVIIIIGILAAIALPIFIDQQKQAVDASVKSDVRNTVENVQNWRVDHRFDAAANTNAYKAAGGEVAKSRGGSVIGVVAKNDGSYTVCSFNDSGSKYTKAELAWSYSSETGQFTITPSASCAGAVNDAGDDLSTTPTSPSITSSTLTDATQDTSYNGQLVASGNPAPTYSAPDSGVGALPAGLNLEKTTGKITGTPTTAGSYAISVTVKNIAGSQTSSVALKVTSKDSAPRFTSSATAPSGLKGTQYDTYTIAADGYPSPSLSIPLSGQGALPSGLAFAVDTGKITGTPTESGHFDVKVTATNRVTSTVQTLSLDVNEAAKITTTTLNSATRGAQMNPQTISTSGYPNAKVEISNLPAGLSLVNNSLSGTPTTSGTYQLNATASNNIGAVATQVITFTVNEPAVSYSANMEECGSQYAARNWVGGTYNCSGFSAHAGGYGIYGNSNKSSMDMYLAPLTANRQYSVTFWARTGSSGATLTVFSSDGTSKAYSAPSNSWNQYTYTFIASGSTISFRNSAGQSSLYLDDMVFTPLN